MTLRAQRDERSGGSDKLVVQARNALVDAAEWELTRAGVRELSALIGALEQAWAIREREAFTLAVRALEKASPPRELERVGERRADDEREQERARVRARIDVMVHELDAEADNPTGK